MEFLENRHVTVMIILSTLIAVIHRTLSYKQHLTPSVLNSETFMWRLLDCDAATFSGNRKKRPLRSVIRAPSSRSGCISSLCRSEKKNTRTSQKRRAEKKKKPAPHLFLLAQHRAFARGGSRGCPCFLLPPSLHPSPSFLLNRCQRWVKSSPEGPASSILVYN